jgi:hypothetical protein
MNQPYQEQYDAALKSGFVGTYDEFVAQMAQPASEAPDAWTLEQQQRIRGEIAEAGEEHWLGDTPAAPAQPSAPTPAGGDELEADEGDDEEPEVAPFTPDQKKVSFTVHDKAPTTSPLPEGSDVPTLIEALSLFRESYANVTQVMDRQNALLERLTERDERVVKALADKGKPLTDEDGNVWLRTVFDAISSARLDNIGLAASEREGSHWTNVLEVNGRELRPGIPKQTLGDPKQLTKEELVGYFQRKTGTGSTFDVPCYRSGLWLRFSSPTLADLTGLQYELNQVKVSLGRESKGLAFSNTLQALMSVAMDFALQYVIDANISFRTPTDIKERLDSMDEQHVLLGLAAVMWPKGYPYAAPCMADASKCQHITKDILNFRSMVFTDENSLTKWQKEFMALRLRKASDKATDADLAKYKAEHMRGKERTVWFGDMGLELHTPSVLQHEESGKAWIDGIVEMTQGAFNEPPHGTNRNRWIEQLGQATTARQYAHWVSAVVERDEEGTVTEVTRETDVIAGILGSVMSDDDYAEDFFKKIQEYIEESMISMVAINSYNCPHCESPVAEKFHARFDHLVPLDMLTTVFTLANRKLN